MGVGLRVGPRAAETMPSYFLPPVIRKVPYPERTPEVRSVSFRSLFLWFWHGVTVEIGGVSYQGGRWCGPLSSAEIAAITAAGYATRIYNVNDLIELPANIPEDIA